MNIFNFISSFAENTEKARFDGTLIKRIPGHDVALFISHDVDVRLVFLRGDTLAPPTLCLRHHLPLSIKQTPAHFYHQSINHNSARIHGINSQDS